MLMMCVPSDEELDLEEDESGTGQKRGMRAPCVYRPWVGHWASGRRKHLPYSTGLTD